MKETTRILIENEIIPKSVAQMCAIWNDGTANPVEATPAEYRVKLAVQELVAKLTELLDESSELPELRETEFDLDDRIKHAHLKGTLYGSSNSGQEMGITMRIGFTRTGRLILKVVDTDMRLCERFALKGNVISVSNGKTVKLVHIEPRYAQERLSHYVCDVEYV